MAGISPSISGITQISAIFHKQNSVIYDQSLLGATAGTATASKALILNSAGNINFGLGNLSTNSISFSGGTANKEVYSIFHESDDMGLTIGPRATTTQKATPILKRISGFDMSILHQLIGFSSLDPISMRYHLARSVRLINSTSYRDTVLVLSIVLVDQ